MAAVRLHEIAPQYEGKVKLRMRAFPLEIYGGGPPDRTELELEIWQAALQEPDAVFKPFQSDWPKTTLPAFQGAWCAFQQGEKIGRDFDLNIRKAFFVDGRDIGSREIVLAVAHQTGLDMDRFARQFEGPEVQNAVLEEGRLGKEKYGVTETPTVMLPDGTKLQDALAMPKIENGRIVAVGKLACCGDGCYDAERSLFERALGSSGD